MKSWGSIFSPNWRRRWYTIPVCLPQTAGVRRKGGTHNGTEGKTMLALARSEGQSIIIDGHIEVKIVKWSRSSVRLAIQAPREVRVDRDETWRKMNPGQMTPLEIA